MTEASNPSNLRVKRYTYTRDECQHGVIQLHSLGEYVAFHDYDSLEGNLQAEIERLTRELADARAEVAHAAEEHADLLKRWGAVVDDRNGLLAALAKHGQHAHDCASMSGNMHARAPCSCGLAAALSGDGSSGKTAALCPHGMPLAENVCGPCSEGRLNRPSEKATGEQR